MTSVTTVTAVAPAQRGMKTIQRAERAEARGVNGEEEDTLSKARKAAKVHLNALKEHVEEAWRGQFGDFNAHPKYFVWRWVPSEVWFKLFTQPLRCIQKSN
jgi:hypothetical protein